MYNQLHAKLKSSSLYRCSSQVTETICRFCFFLSADVVTAASTFLSLLRVFAGFFFLFVLGLKHLTESHDLPYVTIYPPSEHLSSCSLNRCTVNVIIVSRDFMFLFFTDLQQQTWSFEVCTFTFNSYVTCSWMKGSLIWWSLIMLMS